MMKMNLAIILIIISSVSKAEIVLKDYEKKIKNFYNIKNVVDKIQKNEIEDNLRDFVLKTRPSRVYGSKGHASARDYIEEKLKLLKSPTTTLSAHDFTPEVVLAGKMYEADFNKEINGKLPPNDPNFIRWKNFTVSMLNGLNSIKNIRGKNFVWEKKGSVSPNEVIIIGANYDTLNHDSKTMKIDMSGPMPGADNNGTGVVALLNLAKIINAVDFPKTIRLVFFDCEEFGFLGSKSYVDLIKKNSNEKVLGYVNLVMLGNDSKIKDTEKKLNNMKIYLRNPNVDKEAALLDLELVNSLVNAGKNMYPSVQFTPEANGMNSSSHIRFWEAGIPALTFTQNWESDFNPRFHTPDDFVETINMTTFVNSFRYIASGVMAFNLGIVK